MIRIIATLILISSPFASPAALADALIDRVVSGQCTHATLSEEECWSEYQSRFARQCAPGTQCSVYVYPSGLAVAPTTFARTHLRQNMPKLRRAVRQFSSLWTREGSEFPAVDQQTLLKIVVAIGLSELSTRSAEDNYQDLVARLPGGRTLSRGGTLGPFQVSTTLAYSLETRYLVHTELRNAGAWNETTIARNLADFEVNAAYATAFVYHIIKQFRDRGGVDITRQPGVIATLYNLGTPENSARQLIDESLSASRRMPRLNAYGYFVESNWLEAESLVAPAPRR